MKLVILLTGLIFLCRITSSSRTKNNSAIICLFSPNISVKNVSKDMKRKAEIKAYFLPIFFCQIWYKDKGMREKSSGYNILKTHVGCKFNMFEF